MLKIAQIPYPTNSFLLERVLRPFSLTHQPTHCRKFKFIVLLPFLVVNQLLNAKTGQLVTYRLGPADSGKEEAK